MRAVVCHRACDIQVTYASHEKGASQGRALSTSEWTILTVRAINLAGSGFKLVGIGATRNCSCGGFNRKARTPFANLGCCPEMSDGLIGDDAV